MTPVEYYAVACCIIAAAGCGVRAELLRDRLGSPFRAGTVMRVLIDLVAVACVWRAIEIAHGGPVSMASVVLVTALAVASVGAVVHMLLSGWREAIEHAQAETALKTRAEDVAAVADTVPSVIQDAVAPLAEKVEKLDWLTLEPPPYEKAGPPA